MKTKKTMRVFEFEAGPPMTCKERSDLKRPLQKKDVDGAINEARALLINLGFEGKVKSVNVTTDGNIHVVVNKGKQKRALQIEGWRYTHN